MTGFLLKTTGIGQNIACIFLPYSGPSELEDNIKLSDQSLKQSGQEQKNRLGFSYC